MCFGCFGSFEWLVVSIWKVLKTYYYHQCFESLFFSWWDAINYLDRIWDDKILKEKTSAACRYCVKGGSSYRWLVDYDRNVWMVEKCTPHGFCFKMGWVYLHTSKGVKFPAFRQCRNIILPSQRPRGWQRGRVANFMKCTMSRSGGDDKGTKFYYVV
jgi:hypothetical protein